MHAVYAILLPVQEDPEELFLAAENLVQQVADENNWYGFIGVALPGEEVIEPPSHFLVSDRFAIHDLAGAVNGYWLRYVRSLEYYETACVLGLDQDGAEAVRQMVEEGGKEAVIRALAALITDSSETSLRRRVAQRLEVVLDEAWPFPERLISWYRQRVFKHYAVRPEEAAIVLVDIHT
ncbi:MAG TPA: hypothetical protein EYP77_07225 [Anaerolineae bacterium]|nr:hypothetical protein [Anaerolineae bacterium]